MRVKLEKKHRHLSKNKLNKGIKNLQDKEKKSKMKKKIIQQKKLYLQKNIKRKVTELRKKVNSLQKERSTLLDTVSKQRTKLEMNFLKI